MIHPIISLTNGLRIANFSSPHPFNFTTGEILPGVDPNFCRTLSLERVEVEKEVAGNWKDVSIRFELTQTVLDALTSLSESDECDVILCSLPVLQAVDPIATIPISILAKARGCLVADRVEKTIYPDRFSNVFI